MKKYIASVLMLLCVQHIYALTFYEQLCNFNFNWKKYALRAPAGEARHFNSDKEYVQAHLSCVLPILRSNSTAHLDDGQYRSRMHLIGLLDGYRKAGNFPVNYYRNERIPVFIDQHSTHCAVAYLLQQTGHEDMARRIAAADNYAWLKDIHDAEFEEWQKASGFTMEELKLVQGAYEYYMPDALILPNKYEIPQKPDVMVHYFSNPATGRQMAAKPENIWCKGEGKNGVLNGKWIQNYAVGMPWIVGYYENGKRTGQWEEYYQGTKQLCRTEVWRNDKLNGIRKRYDRSGNLIEQIVFKDGVAVTKMNYDLIKSLVYVRKPVDSTLVYTEIYTSGGALLATGKERIHNPGNLQWFQNIELTALNSIAVGARDISFSGRKIGRHPGSLITLGGAGLYNIHPLVQYKKEGEWVYYKEYNTSSIAQAPPASVKEMLLSDYQHYGNELFQSVSMFDDLKVKAGYDSICAIYSNDRLLDFYGYSPSDYTHLCIRYHEPQTADHTILTLQGYYTGDEWRPAIAQVCGQYDKEQKRTGVWKYFNSFGQLYKTENYVIPWKEEEEDKKMISAANIK